MQFYKEDDYSITLSHIKRHTSTNNYLEGGIPFPKGALLSPAQLSLYAGDNVLDCFCHVLSRWSDNSIRWLSIGTVCEEGITEKCTLKISKIPRYYSPFREINNQIEVVETAELVKVFTGSKCFELSKRILSIPTFESDFTNNSLQLRDNLDNALIPWVKNVNVRYFCHPNSGAIKSVLLSFNGVFANENEEAGVNFQADFRFFSDLNILKCDFEIHNPAPALHEGGQWDLGDPNSFLFNSLSVCLTNSLRTQMQYQVNPNQDFYTLSAASFKLEQHASGGANWQSPTHVDSQNRITVIKNGYSVSLDNQEIKKGSRSQPSLLFHEKENRRCAVSVSSFWENFPSALEVINDSAIIHLFPPIPGQFHELQGGEKKTHTVCFSEHEKNIPCVTALSQWKIPPEWVSHCKVLPHYAPELASNGLQNLINQAIEGAGSFFAKREAVDEYGWRNFGDLYADHETAYHKDKGIFVSHYNNQYDPLYGMLRQYITTGDERWLALSDDLARHVVDIDIYHTEGDKPEYNGGLFWHTDHYLEAKTSSHRSYSRHHAQGVYADHAGGGGPGGQHCYTSGLLLHYYLTGNPRSKQAVLTLTHWIQRFYEGTETCLELAVSIRNRHLRGVKDAVRGKYPLDRGTANYLVSLLDSYEVTLDKRYLEQAEHIIRNTFHPNDDIASRDLKNVEHCWFYTVFLQAVGRYLFVKENFDRCDSHFFYARDGLCHYAKWMAEHEQPYLKNPDILEYPNDTWTAQDLRKVNVLLLANLYSGLRYPQMEKRAAEIFSYLIDKLETSPERHYCRILALLMQNTGITEFYDVANQYQQYKTEKHRQELNSGGNVLTTVAKRLKSFSFNHELAWIRTRLNHTEQWKKKKSEKGKKPPLLFVLSIDTEEEWDWKKGFPDRDFNLTNIAKLPQLQSVFTEVGIRPTYFVDYAVADDDEAAATLRPYVMSHQCEIGAHLHPWCNPPYYGITTERESHVVNLPKAQTEAKLKSLVLKLKQQFGVQPQSFRSGRWGIDSTVFSLLIENGFDIDSSVYPFWSTEYFDCSGGPLLPYWPDISDPIAIGNQRSIFEMPVTVGFNNRYFLRSHAVHSAMAAPALRYLRLVGIAWRTRLLRKLYLCPELSTVDDMVTLCHRALDNDYPILHFYMHSSCLLDNENSIMNQNNAFETVVRSVREVVKAAKERREVRFCTLREAAAIMKSDDVSD